MPSTARNLVFAVCLFFALAIFALPDNVNACQPTRTPTGELISLAERTVQVPIILEGTIVAAKKSGTENIKDIATIQVKSYLKGYGPAIVDVSGFGSGPDCRPNVNDMGHGIFFIEDSKDGFHLASKFGLFSISSAEKESISEIRQATGRTPITPVPMPIVELREATASPFCLILLCLVLLIALGVLAVFGLRQGLPKLTA